MRAAGYIRVSTADQVHGFSLSAQAEAIEKYAKDHDMVLVGIYADEGKSASKQLHRRPEILHLLDDCENGKIDVILFKDLSRWSRSPSQFYAVQDRLDKCGVSWIAIEQPNLETVTASGKLIVGIHISVAAHESAQIGERIKFVNASRVKEGGVLSGDKGLPLGYKVGMIDGKKRVVIDKEKAEAAKACFDAYRAKQSVAAARDAMHQYGIFYSDFAVRNMLKTTMFKGEYRGVKGYCEAIVPEEEWEEVQMLRAKRHYTPPKRTHYYIYSSLVKCGECGRTMVGVAQHGYKYYRCKGHEVGLCSNKQFVSELKLDKFMIDNIDDVMSQIDVMVKPKKQKKSLAPLRAKLDRVNELYIEGRLSKEDYDRRTKEIEKEIAENTVEPVRASNPFPNGWKDYYLHASDEAKNTAWRSVIDKIVVKDGFTVFYLP